MNPTSVAYADLPAIQAVARLAIDPSIHRTDGVDAGRFSLPWNPVLDVTGKTVFTMSPENGYRIISYDEEWSIPAAAALKQLITPSQPTGAQES